MDVELVVNLGCELAEGPVWDDRVQALYWVDILAGNIFRYFPVTGVLDTFSLEIPVGAVGLRRQEGLVLAIRDGFALFDPETHLILPLADPESELPGNRFNDGKPGPDGAFWAGTMAYSLAEGAGTLYRLAPDGVVTPQVTGVTLSNGLAWSLDESTLYYVDTSPRRVYAFDFDAENGRLTNRRIALTTPHEMGYPDGMTLDAEGKLWIAHFGGGCVGRWDPDSGTILQKIPLPASQVTCCAFGGDDLHTLYVTTAHEGMRASQRKKEPLAGALFAIRLPVGGMKPYRYAG